MNSLLARFEEVAVALPDATVVLKPDNEIEWSNKVAENLLGIRSPGDAGQRIENLIRTPAFHIYLRNGRFDEPLNINSPRYKGMELSIRIIPFGDGERLLTARDISSFVRVQAMRRDFVANVSHEMRTPLTVMSGYMESLLDDDRLDGEYRDILKSIQRQSQRMQAIVEDLLHLSRLESDLAEQDNTEVQVPKLLNTLAREVAFMAAESGHEIKLVLNEGLFLLGVAYELNSVFTNLLHNALRHTPRGTCVEIFWDIDKEGKAVLRVNDNGPGIHAKHVPRLTERFYRVDEGRSRDTGGTGLGLAIVKHIVQRHDGIFEIQSALGEGSSFICRFSPNRTVLKRSLPEKAEL
jgi:two-component system phosphate regulon sensor histidine kinase PhoR